MFCFVCCTCSVLILNLHLFLKTNILCGSEGAPDQCRYTYEKADLNEFISAIDDEYRVNFVLDGLPSVANKYNSLSGNRYTMGFPLGYKVGKVTHLFNHLEFRIEYTESEKTKGYDEADPAKRKEYYLLGLIVTPHSIEYKNGESPVKAGCTYNPFIYLFCF